MNLKSNNALTLTEVIVGSVLISIMMIGIVSMDSGLRQSHKGSSRNAVLAMRTSAIMLHITKNVELATGDQNNIGIATSATNIWVRRENPAAATPGDYSDDTWLLYAFDATSHNLSFCIVANSTSTACTSGVDVIGTLTAISSTLVIDNTPGSEKFYLDLSLTNRFDPNSSASTFDNPETTLTTRIYPKNSSF